MRWWTDRKLSALLCRVTDAGVIALVAQSPNLQQLSLYWNVHVTDAPLLKVASMCAQLTHLNLSGCKRITDKGLQAVTKKCHHLIDIDLTRYLLQHGFSLAFVKSIACSLRA